MRRVAVVYGAPAGLGGLGFHAATVLQAVGVQDVEVHAFGPGRVAKWPLEAREPKVRWYPSPEFVPAWRRRYWWDRWLQGLSDFRQNRALGQWAARKIAELRPDVCYVFTEVGLEVLQRAREVEAETILDSPMGHIRSVQEICRGESLRWCDSPYFGHPGKSIVDRVEQEYDLADRIRVCSQWARGSLVTGGVEASKVSVVNLPLNLSRFAPARERPSAKGRLRICFVGSLNLRKGFAYLLRAIKMAGAHSFSLELVGDTGDRWCRRLLESERKGLRAFVRPGDPVPVYQRSELFVLPTLEDGFGLAAAEAMACGLPVVVTAQCGAAEFVRHGVTGWIVPAGDSDALAQTLCEALQSRAKLPAMGRAARTDIAQRAGLDRLTALGDWLSQTIASN